MDYHEKMLLLVSQMQHFNLWHEDRSSSFYGLEARVPYLDHRLVEFLAGFPDHSLERMFWDKAVVREVLAETLEDYPKDRKKVPFIATEDYSTIDNMVLMMAMNLYPAFRMLYLEMDDNPLFRGARLDEIHDSVKNRDDESIESAWRMMAMMSVAVFEKFCRNPKVFLDFVKDDQGPVARRLTDDELGRLEELYPEEPVGARQWALSSTVRIPDRVRLLSGLDANEQDTDLFLHKNDQVAKTLTIPQRDAWVVNMLERLANHQGGPSDIEYWSNEMKVTPQNLCEALDYLVGEGFVEKTA